MRIPYDATLTLPGNRGVFLEYPCEIDVSLGWDSSGPYVIVHDVLTDVSHTFEPSRYVSMFSEAGTTLMAQIGHAIADHAAEDEWLLDKLVDEDCSPRAASVADARHQAMKEAVL